jgi:hypothetical protein
MDKVHIILWSASKQIDSVHADYQKACKIVEKANKEISKWRKFLSIIVGVRSEWVVQTFDIKN